MAPPHASGRRHNPNGFDPNDFWHCHGFAVQLCGHLLPRGQAWCNACGNQPPPHVTAVKGGGKLPTKEATTAWDHNDPFARKLRADAEKKAAEALGLREKLKASEEEAKASVSSSDAASLRQHGGRK